MNAILNESGIKDAFKDDLQRPIDATIIVEQGWILILEEVSSRILTIPPSLPFQLLPYLDPLDPPRNPMCILIQELYEVSLSSGIVVVTSPATSVTIQTQQ